MGSFIFFSPRKLCWWLVVGGWLLVVTGDYQPLTTNHQPPFSIQSNAIGVIAQLRSVGDDHLVAGLQTAADFNLRHGGLPQLHGHGRSVDVVRLHPEEFDLAVFLAERRSLHLEDVRQPEQLDGAVNAKAGNRVFRQCAYELDCDFDRALYRRRIFAGDDSRNFYAAQVNHRLLSLLNVPGLRLGDLDLGLEPRRVGDARERLADGHRLSDLDQQFLQDSIKACLDVQIGSLLLA